MQKRARLIDSEVTAWMIEIRGEMQKTRAFVAGVSLPLFLTLQPPLPPTLFPLTHKHTQSLKVARYSFSGSIPPTFERKLRRHKQRFGKTDTTVVLDEDEILL